MFTSHEALHMMQPVWTPVSLSRKLGGFWTHSRRVKGDTVFKGLRRVTLLVTTCDSCVTTIITNNVHMISLNKHSSEYLWSFSHSVHACPALFF